MILNIKVNQKAAPGEDPNKLRDFVDEKIRLFEEANPTTFVNEPKYPSMFHKPKYTSMKQIKKDQHKNIRTAIDLLLRKMILRLSIKNKLEHYNHKGKLLAIRLR